MTRTGLVDLSAAGGALAFVSPAGLARAAGAASLEFVEPERLAEAEVDRLIAVVPPWIAEEPRAALASGRAPIEVVDPWAAPASAAPAYHLLPRDCHADVDLAPHRWPVHPWIVGSPGLPAADLGAAFEGLRASHTTRLVLADERARLTDDRTRRLAELVTASIRNRKSLVELALRAWPEDLAEGRAIDHLSLLPVAGLDLLVGTLHAPSREARGACSADEAVRVIAAVAKAGLGRLTTLSLALALPGEAIQETIAALDRALRLAVEHRLAGVRCALWLGPDGRPPASAADQAARFRATHPSWTEEEYRGIHDLVAVIRGVATSIELVGPGFLPSWDGAP